MKEKGKIILGIESSTTVCSVAMGIGEKIIAVREIEDGKFHSEFLHGFVAEVMIEAGLHWNDLDAVAVSKGPGSYTGLRIGVSAAKGYCYALGIPLIGVDTLQAMARKAKVKFSSAEIENLCPMLDARRMEVYTAIYNYELEIRMPVKALVLEESQCRGYFPENKIAFFGNGMPKAKEFLSVTVKNALFIDDLQPSATEIVQMAMQKLDCGQIENTAYFEPYYLKEFIGKKII